MPWNDCTIAIRELNFCRKKLQRKKENKSKRRNPQEAKRLQLPLRRINIIQKIQLPEMQKELNLSPPLHLYILLGFFQNRLQCTLSFETALTLKNVLSFTCQLSLDSSSCPVCLSISRVFLSRTTSTH